MQADLAPWAHRLQTHAAIDEFLCQVAASCAQCIGADRDGPRHFVGLEKGDGLFGRKQVQHFLGQELIVPIVCLYILAQPIHIICARPVWLGERGEVGQNTHHFLDAHVHELEIQRLALLFFLFFDGGQEELIRLVVLRVLTFHGVLVFEVLVLEVLALEVLAFRVVALEWIIALEVLAFRVLPLEWIVALEVFAC